MDKDIEKIIIELHEKHFVRIVSVLYRKCGDKELSLDIVQDTFRTCIEKKEQLKDHPNIAGWLYVTAINKLNNELKRSRNSLEIPFDDLNLEDTKNNFDKIEYSLPSCLTNDEKEVIIMRLEEQRSFFDISRIKGITDFAARQQYSRAMKKLRKYFDDSSQNTSHKEI